MEDDSVLDTRSRDFLGIAYEVLTSKYARKTYKPLEIGDAFIQLEDVKYEMMKIGNMMGLRGKMFRIFTSLLIDELRDFTHAELVCYADLFHINIPDHLLDVDDYDTQNEANQIAILIFNEHIRRLQRMRMKRYIASIFFGSVESRNAMRPEVFHLDDEDPTGQLLSEEAIIAKGVDYWFPRVGNLKTHMLAERFDYFEALYMMMMCGTPDPRDSQKKDVPEMFKFKITNDALEETAYQRLVAFFTDSKEDVRGYVTLDGIMFAYLGEQFEHFVPLNDIAILDIPTLQLLATQEGFEPRIGDTWKPNVVLMFEWCLSQLGETFISHCGDHRTIMEATKYSNTTNKESPFFLHDSDLLFFGKRDGVSEINVYTMEELCDSFVEVEDAHGKLQIYGYDPISIALNPKNTSAWLRFPRKTISRLLEVVLKSKSPSPMVTKLASKCRRLLNTDIATQESKTTQTKVLQMLQTGDKERINHVLLRIFNTGIRLAELEVDPEDIYDDGVIQQEIQNYILSIEDALMLAEKDGNLLRKLLVIENYYTYNVIHYEDYNYEIGHFLPLLSSMTRLNLNSMLILAGRYLYITASYYSHQLWGDLIGDVSLSFEEQVRSYRDENLSDEDDENLHDTD